MGVLAEQHLLEEAETEQHEFGVIDQQLLHLVCGNIVELREAVADHEFAEAVGVVARREEEFQAALGGSADAGAGEGRWKRPD